MKKQFLALLLTALLSGSLLAPARASGGAAQAPAVVQKAIYGEDELPGVVVRTGYLVPDSSSRYLTRAEFGGFSARDLRIARNEIFARHERMFDDPGLAEYFAARWWYRPAVPASLFSCSALSDIERANIDLIMELESSLETVSQFVFADSSLRLLTEADLANLTEEQVRIAKNEIFARHGRRFRDTALQIYFDSCSWYNGTVAPEAFSYAVFNAVESANVELLNSWQNRGSSGSEYILPDSASRYLRAEELAGLSPWQLRLARNELFARHGRRFAEESIQQYFNCCSWYSGTVAPEAFSFSVFNEAEKANLSLIMDLEAGQREEQAGLSDGSQTAVGVPTVPAVPEVPAVPSVPEIPEVPSVPAVPESYPAQSAAAFLPVSSNFLYIDTESADVNGNGRIDFFASIRSTETTSIADASESICAGGGCRYGKSYSAWNSPYGLCVYVHNESGSGSYIEDEAAIIALINTYGISDSLVPSNSLIH